MKLSQSLRAINGEQWKKNQYCYRNIEKFNILVGHLELFRILGAPIIFKIYLTIILDELSLAIKEIAIIQ